MHDRLVEQHCDGHAMLREAEKGRPSHELSPDGEACTCFSPPRSLLFLQTKNMEERGRFQAVHKTLQSTDPGSMRPSRETSSRSAAVSLRSSSATSRSSRTAFIASAETRTTRREQCVMRLAAPCCAMRQGGIFVKSSQRVNTWVPTCTTRNAHLCTARI